MIIDRHHNLQTESAKRGLNENPYECLKNKASDKLQAAADKSKWQVKGGGGGGGQAQFIIICMMLWIYNTYHGPYDPFIPSSARGFRYLSLSPTRMNGKVQRPEKPSTAPRGSRLRACSFYISLLISIIHYIAVIQWTLHWMKNK